MDKQELLEVQELHVTQSHSDIHKQVLANLSAYGYMLTNIPRNTDEIDDILECMRSCMDLLVRFEHAMNYHTNKNE